MEEKKEQEFDFSVLWKDEEEEGGLTKLAPLLNLIVSGITLITILIK